MDLKERIRLDRQTVETLERIEANGGNVPDGYRLECKSAGCTGWCLHGLSVETLDASWWFRLTPTPRFTVSTDPCGVLDSERPGWIAKAVPVIAVAIADSLNSGKSGLARWDWTQLPKPQIPLGPDDVLPNSVFRDKDAHEGNWIGCGGVDETGVLLGRRYVEWSYLKDNFLILRPGCDTYHACSKDAP